MLATWLGPLDKNEVSLDTVISSPIPRLHINWEIKWLAKIIGINPTKLYHIYTSLHSKGYVK